MGFLAFPYFISQCSWILYFVIYFLILTLFPSRTEKVVIRSIDMKNNDWDSSLDPLIFAHISDAHVSSVIPDYNKCFEKTLATALKYKPNFTLNTGDLVDNFDSNGFPRYGVQVEDSWKIYEEIIQHTKYLDHNRIYSVAGNHDMFGVLNYSSRQNYFTKYMKEVEKVEISNCSSFEIQIYSLNSENGVLPYYLISLNPFLFPTAHPSMLLKTTMKKKFLNEIETLIEKYPKPIIMSHYPIASIHSEKSDKHRTFKDIIGSNDVMVYFAGHSHPSNVDIHHYGKGNVEMIGPSTRTYHEKFGIVTIDNGRLVWSLINQNDPTEFILTNPVPKEQLSIHSNFAERNTEIRIIDFNQNNKRYMKTEKNSIAKLYYSLLFTDTNKLVKEGEITTFRTMKTNNFSLYSEPLNITENGEYKLIITGDYHHEINFIVDSITEVGDEIEPENKRVMDHLVYLFTVIFIVLIIIVFPLKKTFFTLEDVEDWIEGNIETDLEFVSNNDNSISSSTTKKNSNSIIDNEYHAASNPLFKKISNWLFTVFLGFLLVRTRFQKNPLIIKLMALFFLCSSLFIPSLLFETEGKVGMIWIYGVVIENASYFVDFGVVYGIIYLLMVCFPMIVLISNLGVKKRSRWQYGDAIFALIMVIGVPFICVRSVIQATGRFFVFLSPQFVLFPVLILIMFISRHFFFLRRQKIIHEGNPLEEPLNSPSI